MKCLCMLSCLFLFFFLSKTQLSTWLKWLSTLPNGTHKTWHLLKINPGHSEAKGLFRITNTICIWNYNFQFQKGVIQYRYGLIFIRNIRQKSFHSERRHNTEIQALVSYVKAQNHPTPITRKLHKYIALPCWFVLFIFLRTKTTQQVHPGELVAGTKLDVFPNSVVWMEHLSQFHARVLPVLQG